MRGRRPNRLVYDRRTCNAPVTMDRWERMRADGRRTGTAGCSRHADNSFAATPSQRTSQTTPELLLVNPPPPSLNRVVAAPSAVLAPSDNLDRSNRRRSTLHTCPRHPARRSSNTGGGLSYSLIRYYKQRGTWTWAWLSHPAPRTWHGLHRRRWKEAASEQSSRAGCRWRGRLRREGTADPSWALARQQR